MTMMVMDKSKLKIRRFWKRFQLWERLWLCTITVGRIGGYATRLQIPLTKDVLPAALSGVELTIQIAGRSFTNSFPAQTNLTYEFVWDGRDSFGRDAVGSQTVKIEVAYLYPQYYGEPRRLRTKALAFAVGK